ncbi:glycerophosphodiester phosphodiesterase [Megalodesulfovibrio paquesii]
MLKIRAVLAASLVVVMVLGMHALAVADFKKPIVFGHRGACGYRPEHTLASYELAIDLGADFIEPDLVSTKDGRLVCRHENEIGGTTDVAEKFPDRKKTKSIDGLKPVDGWYTEDFTLEELKTLRCKERLDFRDQSYNGKFDIPTLEEVIELVRRKEKETGRVIGIIPETKHPSYHKSLGLNFEKQLVEILHKHGYDQADSPCVIQSFEVANLKELRGMTKLPLVFLYDEADISPYDFVLAGDKRTYGDLLKPEALKELAGFVQWVSPWKRLFVTEKEDGSLNPPTSFIEDAHKAGLLVATYTMRNEPRYLAKDYNGDPEAEYLQYYKLGVDGVFSDFPDTALKARTKFLGGN